jgi:hypothetical protein
MRKKKMLLALAVTALFAIPSAASAEQIHFKGVTSFVGSGGAVFLTAEKELEPKISCTAIKVENGKFDTGSSTTGSFQLDFTGCTAVFMGIKGNCNTAGAASGTIRSGGTFHLITTSTKKPGILVTPETTTIICTGFSRVEVTGPGIIGTITSPACGASSTKMTVSFKQAGGTQEHLEYTGIPYDLVADTENSSGVTSGASGTAGLEGTATLESATAGTLECT